MFRYLQNLLNWLRYGKYYRLFARDSMYWLIHNPHPSIYKIEGRKK